MVDGPSRTTDVATRLGRSANSASAYRARLIAAGVIRRTAHGRVDFAVLHLREHLRELAAEGG